MRNLFSKKADVPAGPVDFLIVGLGNPGKNMTIPATTRDLWR